MWGLDNKTDEVRANGYEIKNDKKISEDEVTLYESTEIKDPQREKMLEVWVAGKIKEGLDMVMNQANDILNSYKEWEIPNAEQVQALQIILRQAMNLEEWNDAENGAEWTAKKWKKVIAINWNWADLMAVFWWSAESYMGQRAKIEEKFWKKAISLLDKVILGSKTVNDFMEQKTFDKIRGWVFEKGTDELYHINQEEAATFLKNTEWVNNAENPREFYEKLKKEKNSLLWENVIASIQSLLEVKQDWNLESIRKDDISNWQRDHKDDEIFKSYKVNGKSLSEAQIVDWKLWIMTIRALIASWTEINKTAYNVSDKMNMSGNTDRKDAKEFDIDHDFDHMETNNQSKLMYSQNLQNYWEWWDKGFQFKNWWIDGEWRRFVELDWNRLLEKWEAKEGRGLFDTSRKLLRTYVDENGNEHPIYRDSLSMGDFEDNILVKWQELALKDWKQVSSTSFDKYRDRGDWEWKSRIWVVRIWDSIDNNGDFRGKWRIDLFWEDDTKRLNKDQLKNLNFDDISHVLDQAIAAFKETHHKPSEVWRYNLNRIIDRVLSEVWKKHESAVILRQIAWKDSFYWEWPKSRVENFFNLNDWLRSNLDHKIDKDDMTPIEKNIFKWMEKGMDHFDTDAENQLFNKFKEDPQYDNKHTPDNFRRWLVWNRIITRLEWLQKAYSVLKPKDDNQSEKTPVSQE